MAYPPAEGRLIVLGAVGVGSDRERLKERFRATRFEGLVVTRYGYGAPCSRIEIVEAAIPCPMPPAIAAAHASSPSPRPPAR